MRILKFEFRISQWFPNILEEKKTSFTIQINQNAHCRRLNWNNFLKKHLPGWEKMQEYQQGKKGQPTESKGEAPFPAPDQERVDQLLGGRRREGLPNQWQLLEPLSGQKKCLNCCPPWLLLLTKWSWKPRAKGPSDLSQTWASQNKRQRGELWTEYFYSIDSLLRQY